MPLPPALLAKLKSRGIVTDKRLEEIEPQEEVIAESYDEPEEESSGAPACPNKTNPHHRCTLFCYERWSGGLGDDVDTVAIERKRRRMLRKYPLPSGWEEIFDPHTARYYYWDPDTDDLCWLSPAHPRAVVVPGGRVGTPELYDPESNAAEEDEPVTKKSKKDKKKKKALDPMDPAAYSDIGEGTWSSGLEKPGDAKTGVDHTVSGPLFQQRPYPAPGAILKQNAKLTK